MTIKLKRDIPDPEGKLPPLKAGVPYEIVNTMAGYYMVKDEKGNIRAVSQTETLEEFSM